jgi:site-specific DNA recombinase
MRCGIYVRVSTDDQRDNGYSIDSQLRMIKEYCEKNEYDIVDVYNDAGHSGKDLMRPEMQRLLKDIKSKKIDKLVAIKVDRLTRNNYDGFWLLNYCEEHDVKIELILEPYDVSTANGEMIFGMNLVFGQRERKEKRDDLRAFFVSMEDAKELLKEYNKDNPKATYLAVETIKVLDEYEKLEIE